MGDMGALPLDHILRAMVHFVVEYLSLLGYGNRESRPDSNRTEQRLYRDRQVLTETGQRLSTETATEPLRKTETVECIRERLS